MTPHLHRLLSRVQMQQEAFLPLLLAAVQRHLSESAEAHKGGDPNWWRPREAALLALGSIRKVVAYVVRGAGG